MRTAANATSLPLTPISQKAPNYREHAGSSLGTNHICGGVIRNPNGPMDYQRNYNVASTGDGPHVSGFPNKVRPVRQ
jgi:hypothetical protein